MADADSDDARKARLKSALWYSIGQIVDSEAMTLNMNASQELIMALTELVWRQLENCATDLESFSRHAGRTTITTDDVLLLCRRNEGLAEVVGQFVQKEKAEKETQKEKEKEKPKPSRTASRGRGRGRGKT